jgi:hypothetical protein
MKESGCEKLKAPWNGGGNHSANAESEAGQAYSLLALLSLHKTVNEMHETAWNF